MKGIRVSIDFNNNNKILTREYIGISGYLKWRPFALIEALVCRAGREWQHAPYLEDNWPLLRPS